MRAMGVVETRILRFDAIKGAVECGCFDAHFWDEVARYVACERAGVVGALFRKKVSVDNLCEGGFMHFVRRWSRF